MHAEISYDLVMDDDMSFVEGTYRLLGGDWQVVPVPPLSLLQGTNRLKVAVTSGTVRLKAIHF